MSREHRVVIVGGGFAGLNAARALSRAPVKVTVIDRRNFHLFQPLLYQVAIGALSPADISTPIRALLRNQRNAQVILGDVESVDVPNRRLGLSDGQSIEYDTLVVAAGAGPSYFGRDEWKSDAPALKTIEDATEIRRRILLAFEAAERTSDPEERAAWLTFVIIGGGPTRVELAGAIGELAHGTLKRDFRTFDPSDARVFLFEGGDRMLPTYHEDLSAKAVAELEGLGVSVRTQALVKDVQKGEIEINIGGDASRLSSRTVVWAAGVQASGLGRSIADATGAEVDRDGSVVVEPDLTLPGHPDIFVVGDLASYTHQTGSPLRGTADVAISEGRYVGNAIRRRLANKDVKSFRFRDLGTLAVIGRSAAVADLRVIRFSGRLAWWTWLLVHILKLVDFENRLTVLVHWGWNYLTRNRSARLITGSLDTFSDTLTHNSRYSSLDRQRSSHPDGMSNGSMGHVANGDQRGRRAQIEAAQPRNQAPRP